MPVLYVMHVTACIYISFDKPVCHTRRCSEHCGKKPSVNPLSTLCQPSVDLVDLGIAAAQLLTFSYRVSRGAELLCKQNVFVGDFFKRLTRCLLTCRSSKQRMAVLDVLLQYWCVCVHV